MKKRKIESPSMKEWNLINRCMYRAMEMMRYPELPSNPRIGKGYEYWPDGAVTAEGKPTYSCIRIGGANKLMISLCGGGVSFNSYTAARPNKLGSTDQQVFYSVDAEPADMLLRFGINGRSAKNPFRDWNILLLPYTTGDFHCGRNDFNYIDRNGQPAVLHHRGYDNYRRSLEKMRELVLNPEKLIVTGFSAGAFGAALLADDIIGVYPNCSDVTVICDSAMMHHDWRRIAQDVWHAPGEIIERLNGKEIVTDSLTALHQKHPHAKIMFCCSCRDSALTQFAGFLEENGNWIPTKQTGDLFQQHLSKMAEQLMEKIPDIAMFIFQTPDKKYAEAKLTSHCVCFSSTVFTTKADQVTVIEWLKRGVNGEMLRLGLDCLRQP